MNSPSLVGSLALYLVSGRPHESNERDRDREKRASEREREGWTELATSACCVCGRSVSVCSVTRAHRKVSTGTVAGCGDGGRFERGLFRLTTVNIA